MQVILETERLFLRKMTMEDFDSLYVVLAIPVCAVATFAAVQEGHFIRTGRDEG